MTIAIEGRNEWREGQFKIMLIHSISKEKFYKTVKGRILGPLGVSKYRWGGFTVTHIPTGKRVAFADSLKEAVCMVEALLSVDDVDWSRTDPTYYETLPGAVMVTINQIRDGCHCRQGGN